MMIFNFEEMGKNDKTVKEVIKMFKKNGVVIPKELIHISATKRTNGISYKELTLTTSDSRQVQFLIKQTGDIYRVKLSVISGKTTRFQEVPIKNQHDHELAIKEIAAKIERERKPYQAKLAKIQENALSPEVKSKINKSRKTIETLLTEEIQTLDEALVEVEQKIAELKMMPLI